MYIVGKKIRWCDSGSYRGIYMELVRKDFFERVIFEVIFEWERVNIWRGKRIFYRGMFWIYN